jgi:hypothetical protein
MKELGAGFLENFYKNALFIAMKQKGLNVLCEQTYEVAFRKHKIGKYVADLVVDNFLILTILPSCYFSIFQHPGPRNLESCFKCLFRKRVKQFPL